jgi:uncharacterized SAM-binding protein YcdF (DUF218 family)/glycosyltransferase involved in cell wall biosynthesis
MPAPYDVICISSIDWDFIWQSHQEIMSRYAARGHRVLFIENTGLRTPQLRDVQRIRRRWHNWRRGVYGIRKERDNLFIFSPLIIPLPNVRPATWVNQWLLRFILQRWMRAVGFTHPIIWAFLPTQLTLDLLDHLDHRLLVYYCAARFSMTPSTIGQRIEHTERRLLKQADLVFAISRALADHCAQHASRVHLFPLGVNLQVFDASRQLPVPSELEGLARPIIGYIGGVHQWVDVKLLRAAALAHPDYAFVFVGPVQTDTAPLADLPNVVFIGERSHRRLPAYVQAFDVGIIPYRVTDYTRHVYPSKLNEYLAMGKPVVSTDLSEVREFQRQFDGVVRIGRDAAEFSQALEDALQHRTNGVTERCQRAAAANNWDVRVTQMSSLVHEALEDKWEQQERQWHQVLVSLARASTRRFLKALWPGLVAYLVLFHTPMLWWVAKPLRMSQSPVRADAIVVFAGGVGESGQAGQGHQERIAHAVSLYHQGYAPILLLSSGYRYALQEADVMRVLAVSLGVPAEAITLEESAANTYENVLRSAALLRRHGYRSALVVSSPFHMRRVSLVWRKAASDIDPTWSPIPYSHFFGDQRTVHLTLKHWQAILHEYLGMLYYWWKGWI